MVVEMESAIGVGAGVQLRVTEWEEWWPATAAPMSGANNTHKVEEDNNFAVGVCCGDT